MKFTLKSFNDLGRCSYGTLKDSFDTELDTIYYDDVPITICRIEDLFPYLWQSPGISGHSQGKSFAIFYRHTTHWEDDYSTSIKSGKARIKTLESKIKKSTSESRKQKYRDEIDWEEKHIATCESIISKLNDEMEHQKKRLTEENK